MPSEYVPKPNGSIDLERQAAYDMELAAAETDIELLGENWPADPGAAHRILWRIRRRVKVARYIGLEMAKSREFWWNLQSEEYEVA